LIILFSYWAIIGLLDASRRSYSLLSLYLILFYGVLVTQAKHSIGMFEVGSYVLPKEFTPTFPHLFRKFYTGETSQIWPHFSTPAPFVALDTQQNN